MSKAGKPARFCSPDNGAVSSRPRRTPALDELGNYVEAETGFCSPCLRKSRSVTPSPAGMWTSPDVCDPYIRPPPEPQARSLPLRTRRSGQLRACRIPAERQPAATAARSSAGMTCLRTAPLSSVRCHVLANPQCADTREDGDVVRRPGLPCVSPVAQLGMLPATRAPSACSWALLPREWRSRCLQDSR